MKTRVLLVFLSIILLLAGFTSCISITENESTDYLSLFLSEARNATNVEFNKIQITTTDQLYERQYAHVEYTKTPFGLYQKIGTFSENSFVIIENYLHDKGETADYSIKVSVIQPFDEKQLFIDENGGFEVEHTSLIDQSENTTTLKGDQKEWMIKYFDEPLLYDIGYLIEKNRQTFNKNDEKTGNADYIRYDGTISADSILDSYANSGRERIEAKMKMHDIQPELKKNASKEEMREELMNLHNGTDIAEGSMELIFADVPTPISIWIPIDTEEPYRVKIDYSNAYRNKSIKLFGASSQISEYSKTVEYSFFIDR